MHIHLERALSCHLHEAQVGKMFEMSTNCISVEIKSHMPVLSPVDLRFENGTQ